MNELPFDLRPEHLMVIGTGLLFWICLVHYLLKGNGFFKFLGAIVLLGGLFLGAPMAFTSVVLDTARQRTGQNLERSQEESAETSRGASSRRSKDFHSVVESRSPRSRQSDIESRSESQRRRSIVDDALDVPIRNMGEDPDSSAARHAKEIARDTFNPFTSSEERSKSIRDAAHSIFED